MQSPSYNLIPQNYTLTFNPDMELFVYSGKEILTFELLDITQEIVLDSVGLEVVSCVLLQGEKPVTCEKRVEGKHLYIRFPQALKKGTYVIELIFNGVINEYLAGWYKSRYVVDGKLKYCATSHFEPADARRAFPCVDHPDYKATFAISFVLENDLEGISNMPIVEEKDLGTGKKLVQFGMSPIMSTYLVYLGVGEFEFVEERHRNVTIRGVAHPGKSGYAKFAVEETKKYLAYFEEYFGVEYPLPKVDLIAVADFAAGAMENWGAITFRENALLFYPGKTSIITKQHIAETIAHELAHQWFGNLVTMKWWDDLWLNESFATFMANKAIDYYYPDWHVWTRYVIENVFEGMSLDSLRTSHPIQVEVGDVEQINELFDEIAYQKGGSILRMLEEYLTADRFRAGLREYIPHFAYANAQGHDLWETLEKVSQKPVVKVMESFITQTGFPEVFVDITKDVLTVAQKRFSFGTHHDKQLWSVPVVWKTEEGIGRHLLELETEAIRLSEAPQFVQANVSYAGFYITSYAGGQYATLRKHLAKVGVEERLGLVHDFYYFVLSGKYTVAEFVEFVENFFLQEQNPTVLSYVISKLSGLYLLLEKATIAEVASQLAHSALQRIAWEPVADEDPEHVVLRNVCLYALGLFGNEQTYQFALDKFAAFLEDESRLHQDLRGTIYALAVWAADENYGKVLELYKKTEVQEEKAKFLAALARTRNRTLLLQTLDYALSTEVSFSNTIYIFSSLSRNPAAKELTVDWIRGHWEALVQSGGGMAEMILRYILKYTIPQFGIGREKLVEEFLGSVKGVGLQKTFEQIKEELEIHSRMVERNKY